MVSKVGQVDDEGGDYRGSVSPQQFWQIICGNSKPFLDLFNATADKDGLIAKFKAIDEDFTDVLFDEQDVEGAESAWNGLDGDTQEKVIDILDKVQEIKDWLTAEKGKLVEK